MEEQNIAWHIPKRSNLLQIIGSLHILKELNLDGKKWTSTGAAKAYNQALGTWGLTNSGNSLSSTARETLEALIKFLGLLYIDKEKIAHITPAGHRLIQEFPNFKKPTGRFTLGQSEKIYNYSFSKTIKNQLIKLVISNPTISENNLSKKFCLNPFIETLRYLCDAGIGHLTREEMAMFVFYQNTPEEFEDIKQKILHFRTFNDGERIKRVRYFAETYVGNKIYGESSATVKYWEGLVEITGLFDLTQSGFQLNKDAFSEARKIIDSHEYPTSDLFENELEWWEYYGNAHIDRLPRKLDYSFPELKDFKLLFTYQPAEKKFLQYFEPKLKVDGDSLVRLTVFPNVDYKVNLKVLLNNQGGTTDITFNDKFTFNKNEFAKEVISNKSVQTQPPSPINFKEELKQMIGKNSISSEYIETISQLLVLVGAEKNIQSAKKYIGKSMALVKGGRFEKLFYELLKNKEKEKTINKVIEWRGREKNGISLPSSAGQGFETDIEFIVNNYYFGFELTTATGRLQWKTEAESVTDHIKNLKENLESRKEGYRVVGIFTAPMITEFMKAICYYFSEFVYKVPILPIPARELFDMFESSRTKEEFISKINQYHKTIFKRNLP